MGLYFGLDENIKKHLDESPLIQDKFISSFINYPPGLFDANLSKQKTWEHVLNYTTVYAGLLILFLLFQLY